MSEQTRHIEISEDVKLYFDELRIKLAYSISVTFSIVFAILTYAYYFDSYTSCVTMFFGFLVCFSCLFVIHYKKNYQLVFFLYSTLGVLVTSFALITFHETTHLVDVLWMLAAVSLAFFSIGKRLGIILLIISLGVIAYFIVFSLNINIETVKPRTAYQKISLIAEMMSGFIVNFYLFYMFLNVNKYSMKKLREVNEQLIEQNYKIKLQNDEKTTLVKEIHHRVKNNLQIVISLLRLQSMELDNEEIKVHFQESINRVMAMALIHRKLYQNDSLSQVQFSEYANDLITTILQTDAQDRTIDFYIHSEIERVGLKSLIPIGLILNELVSNSLKHAFSDSCHGSIDLVVENYQQEGNWLRMIYKDSGKWKDSTKPGQSFGLVLVKTLVEQLDGHYEVEKDEVGTTFVFTLQNIDELDVVN